VVAHQTGHLTAEDPEVEEEEVDLKVLDQVEAAVEEVEVDVAEEVEEEVVEEVEKCLSSTLHNS
jgi:hypothetical protein